MNPSPGYEVIMSPHEYSLRAGSPWCGSHSNVNTVNVKMILIFACPDTHPGSEMDQGTHRSHLPGVFDVERVKTPSGTHIAHNPMLKWRYRHRIK